MNRTNKRTSKKTESIWINLMALGALAWFPSVQGLSFIKNSMDFAVFAILYLGISIPVYLYINKRFKSSNSTETPLLVKIVCMLAIIMLNASLIYLYAYRILISKESLLISLLFSVFLIVGCVEAWVRGVSAKEEVREI